MAILPSLCKLGPLLPYLRIINIEKPVETHIHTERDIDQIVVLLLQTIINSSQTVNYLQDIHGLVILLEVVLVQGITCSRQAQEIHCKKNHTKAQMMQNLELFITFPLRMPVVSYPLVNTKPKFHFF